MSRSASFGLAQVSVHKCITSLARHAPCRYSCVYWEATRDFHSRAICASPKTATKKVENNAVNNGTSSRPDVQDASYSGRAFAGDPGDRGMDSTPTRAARPVTLFSKAQGKAYNFKFDKNKPVTLFFPKQNKAVHIELDKVINLTMKKDKVERETPLLKTRLSIDEFSWKEVHTPTVKQLPSVYAKLAKLRLTGLVVTTTVAGYFIAPGAGDPLLLLYAGVGTGLTSASANTVNQVLEVPYDAQMNRTKNRPLVTGALTPLHGVCFAAVSGLSGLGILFFGANPLTAGLGLFNLALYTLVYTPMKRFSIVNTWLGSVVGAIPPVMGWVACTGSLDPGALLLGAILFAWQFPHFNSLSWNLRPDYSRAGYRMMSVVNPELCKRVALRYSIALVGLGLVAPILNVTSWVFPILASPFNLYMSYLAFQFYRKGDSSSSRRLFRFTLIHIPIVMFLMIVAKKRQTSDVSGTPPPVIDVAKMKASLTGLLQKDRTASASISD